MAWQRKIPFGYIIRGGRIQPHPQEADVVQYIFGQYLAGASLLTIAEDMIRQGIRYHQHTPAWNKNMVKRILENAKYTGMNSYPRLVSDEDFTAAQRYGQLPDPTSAHEMERLRARLEQGPADVDTLVALLSTAVRAVRLTPDKNVELELTNGTIIAEKEAQSA